jgi:TP901 family phage tail tape measure protein
VAGQKPILNVQTRIDEKSAKRKLQEQLDKIGEKLTITIASKQGDMKNVSKNISDATRETQKYNRANEDSQALEIKLFKSLEKREALTRKWNTTQDKAIKENQKEELKSLEIEKKIYNDKIKMYAKMFDEIRTQEKNYDSTNTAIIKIKTSMESLLKISKEFGTKHQYQDLDSLNNKMQKISVSSNMTEKELRDTLNQTKLLENQMRNTSKEMHQFGNNSMKWGQMLSTAFKKFAVWMGITGLFFETTRQIKQAITAVYEFDKAMTELKKVADESSRELDAFGKQADYIGIAIGRTGTEVVNATADFERMGYALEEATKMAKDALILTNVGDGIENIDNATESLVTTLKGFGLESSNTTRITDVLNEVSNKYAVTSDDLAKALKRSSAVMSQSGNTFEETIAMYTAGIEILASPEKVSRGLTTISQRLRGLDEDGEAIEGLAPRLQNAFNTYAKGVKIMGDNGQLRSTYNILLDLSNVWDSMSSNQQQYIAELSAGKDQVKTFAALMSNSEVFVRANADALNSQGSAARENAIYLESLAGKVQLFTTTLQTLYKNSVDTDFVKWVVDFGTSILGLVDTVGILNIALVGLSIKVIPMLASAIGSVTLFAPSVTALVVAFGALLTALDLLVYTENEHGRALAKINSEISIYKDNIDDIIYSSKDITDAQYIEIDVMQKKVDKLEEEVKLREKLSKFFSGLSGSDTSDYIADSQKENLTKTEIEYRKAIVKNTKYVKIYNERLTEQSGASIKLKENTKDLIKAQEDLNQLIDNFQSSASELTTIYESLNEKEEISANTLLDLLQKYPEYASQIANLNKNREDGVSLTEILFNLEKEKAIAAIKSNIAEILGVNELTKAKEEELRVKSKLYELETGRKLVEYTSFKRNRAKASDLYNQLYAINKLSLGDFSTSTKESSTSKSDILDKFSAQQQAIKATVDEIDILNSKIARSEGSERLQLLDSLISKYKEQQNEIYIYSEAMRKLNKSGLNEEDLQKINDELMENSKSWNSIETEVYNTGKTIKDYYVEQLEKANNITKELLDSNKHLLENLTNEIIDSIENENTVYENQVKALEDKNQQLEEEAKREGILAEIEEKRLALTKAQQELENIKSQKNVRMLNEAGTSFVYIADPKAIEQKNQEIEEINQNLSSSIKSLAEYDAEVALNIQKKSIQDKINNNQKLIESINNATKLATDAQLSFWGTIGIAIDGVSGKILNVISLLNTIGGLEKATPSTLGTGYDSSLNYYQLIKSEYENTGKINYGLLEQRQNKINTENLSGVSGVQSNKELIESLTKGKTYHNGTPYVSGLKNNETLAKLQVGEAVLPKSLNPFNSNSAINKNSHTNIGGTNISIENITLPNVSNANQFLQQLKIAVATNR